MAIVEAASCGLQVVSTKVGGIPEVLPNELITLTEPNVDSVFNGLLMAIARHKAYRKQQTTTTTTNGYCKMNSKNNKKNLKYKNENLYVEDNNKILCPFECNQRVAELYNWVNISQRTEKVYRRVLKETDPPLGKKLLCYERACKPFILVVSFCYLLLQFLNWFYPIRLIDIAHDYHQMPTTKNENHIKSKLKPNRFLKYNQRKNS